MCSLRRLVAAGAQAVLIVLAASSLAHASYRARPWLFFPYCAVFAAAVLVMANMASSANDPTSLLFVAVGESILLVPVLLPAMLQYSRSRTR